MIKTMSVQEQTVVKGLMSSAIARNPVQFKALASDLGKLSRPSIVRVGLELNEHDRGAACDSLARGISASKQLWENAPSVTAWAWDQIGRSRSTDQVAFSKATAIFQSDKRDALLLNMARTHALWGEILKRDNLGPEMEALHQSVPENLHGNTSNWVMWAALAGTGRTSDSLPHEVHNFSVFLSGRLLKFENGYDTIGSICTLVESLGSRIDREAKKVIRSEETSAAERVYAERVKTSLDHALDIVQSYRTFLPAEVLVYSSREDNAEQNSKEAVSSLFREDDPKEAFESMMKRANTRLGCANGIDAVVKWHAFFDELMAQKESTGLDIGQFRENPVVGIYLTLKGI